jgi:flagellar biogenesis protein FliO
MRGGKDLFDPHVVSGRIWKFMRRTIGSFVSHPRKRKLRVLDVTSLGEKRFVALVRCGRETFLIGGSASSVALLTKLAVPKSRSSVEVQMETRDRLVS